MQCTIAEALASLQPTAWIGFAAIRSVEKRTARNDSTFYRVSLGDASTSVMSTVFDSRPGFRELADGQWKAGDHLKIEGKISTHPQYGKQIEISRARLVQPSDEAQGYCAGDLLEKAPVDLDACWVEIGQIADSLQPDPLRRTIHRLLEEHGERFRRSAAAKDAHHAYYGGLLHHTILMLREAQAIMGVQDFPPVNHHLVLAGILLHDMGKTEEIETYPRSDYTDAGSLLGHSHLVLGWLLHAAAQEGLEGDLLLHLRHIILSHHGELEFGAAVMPQTKEAMLVHLIDNLDAKMQMIHYALRQRAEGDKTTQRLWALDNRAFREAPLPD